MLKATVRRAVAKRRLFWLMLVGMLVSCDVGFRLGDLSHKIIYENATDGRIGVFPYGRGYPEMRLTLEPGATQKGDVLIRDEKPETWVATIEAVDDSGALIFCHRYTNGELKELSDRVIVKTGEFKC